MALKRLRPILVEGTRVGIIMGIGDVVAQTVIEKAPVTEINWTRTAKFTGIGFCVVGPVLRVWYGQLDKLVSKNQSTFKRGLKKMALDQAIMAPALNPVIIFLVGVLNSEPTQRIKERLKNDYLTIMSRNYMLWPLAQTINFSFVPIQYQVLYVQIVATIWNCYISMMVNKT